MEAIARSAVVREQYYRLLVGWMATTQMLYDKGIMPMSKANELEKSGEMIRSLAPIVDRYCEELKKEAARPPKRRKSR
jgi:hypothetical protein